MELDKSKGLEGGEGESFEAMMETACELAQSDGELVALDLFSLGQDRSLEEIEEHEMGAWIAGVYHYFGVDPQDLNVVDERTEMAKEGVSLVPGEIKINVVTTSRPDLQLEIMTFVDGQIRLCLKAVGNHEDENES